MKRLLCLLIAAGLHFGTCEWKQFDSPDIYYLQNDDGSREVMRLSTKERYDARSPNARPLVAELIAELGGRKARAIWIIEEDRLLHMDEGLYAKKGLERNTAIGIGVIMPMVLVLVAFLMPNNKPRRVIRVS